LRVRGEMISRKAARNQRSEIGGQQKQKTKSNVTPRRQDARDQRSEVRGRKSAKAKTSRQDAKRKLKGESVGSVPVGS
jgi:hypothetical protein